MRFVSTYILWNVFISNWCRISNTNLSTLTAFILFIFVLILFIFSVGQIILFIILIFFMLKFFFIIILPIPLHQDLIYLKIRICLFYFMFVSFFLLFSFQSCIYVEDWSTSRRGSFLLIQNQLFVFVTSPTYDVILMGMYPNTNAK